MSELQLPGFLNGSFLLSAMGITFGFISGIFVYCLKSRCSSVECCCIKCIRTPIPVEQLNSITLENNVNNI